MKVSSLVTGGAGFIGSHVANQLLKLGHKVVVLDDLSGGDEDNIPPGTKFYKGSILDKGLIDELFGKYKFSYVYHLAAYAAEGLSHFIRGFNYENNVIGSINLINASINHEVECFVFTSSIAVYGTNTLPLRESHNPKPEDPYGIAKYAVELDLINAQRLFGLDFVIFRPHNVYGKRQNIGDKYRNVVGIFMNQLLQDKPLQIFGDGEQTRAFSHIDDVAPYIAKAVNIPQAKNEIYNIGSDSVYTVNELARATSMAMKKELNLKYLKERKEVMHAYADHSKFSEVFKRKPEIKLEDGLLEMAEWVKQNGVRYSKDFGNIEVRKNLPESWR